MTETRWWWVRHAPVDSGGQIYGNMDLPADCSNLALFEAQARLLPRPATWVVTNLQRTQQTARSLLEAKPHEVDWLVEPRLAEQSFGDWQGRHFSEVEAENPDAWHRFWRAPADHAPPGGESFSDLCERVAGTVLRLTERFAGGDIVCVAHGGTIRAALAQALRLHPDQALSFSVDNVSLTRIDHIAGAPGAHDPEGRVSWRVSYTNRLQQFQD